MGDPLAEPLPAFETAEALRLLEERFGLSGELRPLYSERDLNFEVRGSDGGRYVLKLQNPADSREVVEMQTRAIAHVRRVDPGLPVAPLVEMRDGSSFCAVRGADGRTSQLRLFEHIEGHHAGAEELDEAALYDWGRTVARLGRALRGFFHPAMGYAIQWDVRRFPALRGVLDRLAGEEREAVAELLDRFADNVEPVLSSLRAQPVHNDMSRANVLVDTSSKITGIVDFGDMTHTALVCDLAVTIADVLDGREGTLDLIEVMIAGYGDVTELETGEAAVLSDLIAARCATAVAVTAWRFGGDENSEASADGAPRMLRMMREEGFGRLANRYFEAASPTGRTGTGYRSRPTSQLLESRRAALGPLELSYEPPLHLVRGEGVHLFEADGRRLLDAYNNVPVVGHCHPAVVGAVCAQMRLLNTNTRYLQEASTELAERLLETAPPGFDRVLLVNSGSEANDVAWRLARHASGRRGAIVTRCAYHGVTAATTELSPEEWPRDPGAAPGSLPATPPDVRLVPPPPVGVGAPPVPPGEASAPAEAAAALEETGAGVAALFIDPAFTSDGILGPAPEYLAEAVAAVRAAGGLFVADEVQAGFGRTGEHLWSALASGAEPDLITLGKPMGNGLPVAAVLTRADIADSFMEETGYFSTFGGNTVACAAALAVLRVIEEEGLVDHADEVGRHLQARLAEVAGRHEMGGCVRGWGLLVGVEIVGTGATPVAPGLPDPEGARRVVDALAQSGVLVGRTGPAGNVLKVRPPLVIDSVQADLVAERLDEVLRSAVRSS